MSDVIQVLNNIKAKLITFNAKTSKDRIVTINITIETQNIDELNSIIKALRKIDSVYEVNRRKV